MKQTEIAYLNALKQASVEELDQQVRLAQCLVHENPKRKATVTLTLTVAYDDETQLVVTEYKTRFAHVHTDPQALDATPREGDD